MSIEEALEEFARYGLSTEDFENLKRQVNHERETQKDSFNYGNYNHSSL